MRGSVMFRKKVVRWIYKIVLILALFLFICEYAIYPIILYKCSWPDTGGMHQISKDGSNKNTLKAMFVADTHLLGPFKGHWWDKLRREWQMYRAFQTAVGFFKPEVIFFLGDLFDEGEWVSKNGFEKYVKRFESMFDVPNDIDVHVVVGNHDIGFHYVISPEQNKRFEKAFNTSSVRLLRLKEVNFLLINSMAMEMDGCFLCKKALHDLVKVEETLGCQKDFDSCSRKNNSPNELVRQEYSKPVILQHFPFYRLSDSKCSGKDSAPEDEKNIRFRQTLDCLSKESSNLLLEKTDPRLIMSGHTHHYCLRYHQFKGQEIPEYSVPSFSWRNRNDPSFFLGVFTKDEHRLSKCHMPKESSVKVIYGIGVLAILLVIFRPVIGAILVQINR